MTPEQLITLLQICGYVLLIPAFVFMVGAIITAKKKLEDFPDIPEPSPKADTPAHDPSVNPTFVRRSSRKKQPLPEEPVRTPIVTERIPDAAQQTMQKLWDKFPQCPSTWNNLYPKEDAK